MSAKGSAGGFYAERADALPEPSLAALVARIDALEERMERLEQRDTNSSGEIVSDPVDVLREACADMGISVSADGYVREADAARLLNRSAHTLKNWRDQSRPLSFRRMGNRVEYSLRTLAE